MMMKEIIRKIFGVILVFTPFTLMGIVGSYFDPNIHWYLGFQVILSVVLLILSLVIIIIPLVYGIKLLVIKGE